MLHTIFETVQSSSRCMVQLLVEHALKILVEYVKGSQHSFKEWLKLRYNRAKNRFNRARSNNPFAEGTGHSILPL